MTRARDPSDRWRGPSRRQAFGFHAAAAFPLPDPAAAEAFIFRTRLQPRSSMWTHAVTVRWRSLCFAHSSGVRAWPGPAEPPSRTAGGARGSPLPARASASVRSCAEPTDLAAIEQEALRCSRGVLEFSLLPHGTRILCVCVCVRVRACVCVCVCAADRLLSYAFQDLSRSVPADSYC
ncbi:hypothetical protein GQ55_9G117300 [Panicum hallii var. hallii]|uniref:Uncharacterized protein n=1 Tax=Panicum hallii var. hallii TaxID=1504633 RepID=A0A2T7C2F1_9POAL|nr:hypothetical protein GQ55_9G117300 [Panicum hallii var. hallii]